MDTVEAYTVAGDDHTAQDMLDSLNNLGRVLGFAGDLWTDDDPEALNLEVERAQAAKTGCKLAKFRVTIERVWVYE